MKLSEIKGDAALDALAGLIDPVAEICSDSAVVDAFRSGRKLYAVKMAIKGHKAAVKTVCAVLDGADPDGYEVSLMTLPLKLLEILNDPEAARLFG